MSRAISSRRRCSSSPPILSARAIANFDEVEACLGGDAVRALPASLTRDEWFEGFTMHMIRSGRATGVLMVTNMWPWEGNTAYGIFVSRQVESLRELGFDADVLVVEGQRRRSDYLLAALRMLALNFSAQRPKLVHGHGGETALVVRWYWRGKAIVSYCGDDLLGTPRADGSLTRASQLRSSLLRRLAPVYGRDDYEICRNGGHPSTRCTPAKQRNSERRRPFALQALAARPGSSRTRLESLRACRAVRR